MRDSCHNALVVFFQALSMKNAIGVLLRRVFQVSVACSITTGMAVAQSSYPVKPIRVVVSVP